ncbi:ribosome biogenesis GTPase Der [Jannaschia sp. R86511]|uniref:ribosome biogenesis GTPase Der n=1 Tax=Jannaschia sp. R86511 TaxID=3093853 RepID=UPI0036D272A0
MTGTDGTTDDQTLDQPLDAAGGGDHDEPSTPEAGTGVPDEAAERVLRSQLADYDLAEEDLAVLGGDLADGDLEHEDVRPVVAVVGRPNVGKSTLVNRILGRREAVVQDVPGVTRDRVSYPVDWAGRSFTLVDTGGWDARVEGLAAQVAEQAEVAVGLADAVVFVVDGTVGATAVDEAVVKMLRRAGKPVVLVANKVDDARGEADATALWSLGLGQPYPVSALHGRGSGDMLDAVLEVLPERTAATAESSAVRRVALVGRPNVGKSSLLNALVGSERVVVDSVAGTTRDPVDEMVELGGRTWRVVDTAGIRRKHRSSVGADFYAGLRTQAAIERAEVAVVLVDASEILSEQDVRVVQNAVDAGRAVVLAINKWDLVDDERRRYLERELETELVQVPWAPRVNLSARTGRHLDRLVPAMDRALASWESRVPTGRLNALIAEIVAAHPHPVRGGKQPRILYATQAGVRPPTFVLFTTGFLEAGYRRFVERRLREEFGFEGTPIEVTVRARERRKRT